MVENAKLKRVYAELDLAGTKIKVVLGRMVWWRPRS